MSFQLVLIEAKSLRYSVYSRFSSLFLTKHLATYVAERHLTPEQVEELRTNCYAGVIKGEDK